MGLYRRRIVRFILGIAVLIAVIQILTTLHFSSIYNGDDPRISRKKTRRNENGWTTLRSGDIQVTNTAVLDLRKSKASINGYMLHRL